MKWFQDYGEQVDGYPIRVTNEREVRASAGLLFLLAFISFSNVFYTGHFQMTKLFVFSFLIDFSIRIFIHPQYAPSMIIARFVVAGQTPEYVGAAQKRFAWALGWLLAVIMFVLTVILEIRGPFTMLICVTCLALLFFESAFGICIGCYLYRLFTKDQAQLCPGGACELRTKHAIQLINKRQVGTLIAFIALIVMISLMNVLDLLKSNETSTPLNTEKQDCVIPSFVKLLGHEEMYRKHNNCK